MRATVSFPERALDHQRTHARALVRACKHARTQGAGTQAQARAHTRSLTHVHAHIRAHTRARTHPRAGSHVDHRWLISRARSTVLPHSSVVLLTLSWLMPPSLCRAGTRPFAKAAGVSARVATVQRLVASRRYRSAASCLPAFGIRAARAHGGRPCSVSQTCSVSQMRRPSLERGGAVRVCMPWWGRRVPGHWAGQPARPGRGRYR